MANIWGFPLVIFLSLVIAVLNLAEAGLPSIFFLGDSIHDVGTNNFLPGSKTRADFLYNGIDFANSRPTGRFCNGLNLADWLARHFGYKKSPRPFLSLKTTSLQKKKFKGINFASGGSGILDTTGQKKPKNCISFAEQIQQFSTVKSHLIALMGPKATEKYLSKSLFFINIGRNDFFEYYISTSSIPKEDFLCSLELAFKNHLKTLLDLGARKMGIVNIGPIGCVPGLKVHNATGGCIQEVNDHAQAFNSKLAKLMYELSSECKDLKYSLGDSFQLALNVIKDPAALNFTQVSAACCGTGKLNAEGSCKPDANLCPNRNQYLYWDRLHPTQAACKYGAKILYGGGLQFVAPINFGQLSEA